MSFNFFQQQLQVGKKGEEVVAEFMRNRNHKVIDVSNDVEYQKKDIDFLLENQEGQKCAIEVKTDYKIQKTGNFFFESTYHKDWGDSSGWLDYCEADYICVLAAKEGKLYILKYDKDLILEKAQKTYFYNRDDGCDREAYLLPIGTAKRYGLLVETFDLEVA